MEDATITAKIKSALVSDASTRTSNIDVDTKGGIVILEGTVVNDAQALRAIQLARAVEGVRSVTNNLRLQ
ncbi:MAG TPA: BON domain-containing protein [Burkholderiaceae bacterium]|nr:BON domain-containing protein [Burkholderiaceae bacterium]